MTNILRILDICNAMWPGVHTVDFRAVDGKAVQGYMKRTTKDESYYMFSKEGDGEEDILSKIYEHLRMLLDVHIKALLACQERTKP
jgi:hypothetical protein